MYKVQVHICTEATFFISISNVMFVLHVAVKFMRSYRDVAQPAVMSHAVIEEGRVYPSAFLCHDDDCMLLVLNFLLYTQETQVCGTLVPWRSASCRFRYRDAEAVDFLILSRLTVEPSNAFYRSVKCTCIYMAECNIVVQSEQ